MKLHTERCAKSAWDHFLLTFTSSPLALAPKICVRLVYCELIDDSFYSDIRNRFYLQFLSLFNSRAHVNRTSLC